MVINQDETFMKAYVLNSLMANNREGGRTHCLYCDSKIVKGRTTTPLFFCNIECRAKGQMNISSLGRKATENDRKYRKKRRGTTNTTELCAIWDILRSMDEPKRASWIIESLTDKFGKKRWMRTTTQGFFKKLHHFDKNALVIDKSNHTMRYMGAKNIPFQEALSHKARTWLQNEYEHNTSEALKRKV